MENSVSQNYTYACRIKTVWKLAFYILLLVLGKTKVFFTVFLFNNKNTAIK